VTLSDTQIRVLGCLLEKQRTTPDAYPLSLSSLRLACNQATSRDPVVDYDEATIRDALRGLERQGLIRFASGAGSRTAKYRHLLDDALPLSAPEQALMCTLMLRGAQTPGELKQRSERMHEFAGLDAVQSALESLIARALVERLPRRPGHKEERYAHLLGESEGEGDERARCAALESGDGAGADGDERSAPAREELEQRVARLEREMAELRARVPADGAAAVGYSA
jgi:uncharacterized protein